MNKSILKTTAFIALAAIALVGCKHRKGQNGLEGEDSLTPSIIDSETGLSLTGRPFDEIYSRIDDVNYGPIYFGYDSFTLPPAEIAKIEQVATYMKDNGDVVLIIEGHCDERGSNEYNLSLGEQRALAVRTYLANLGISADRMQSRSYGEEKPAVQGTGESAWRLNRRGEFAFFR